MHPNPLFRTDDPAPMAALVDEIGFGTIVAAMPQRLRVAHTPLLLDGGEVRFHLSNRNALTPHLDGATALAVVDGPNAYVSPRWYADRDAVPTWDYVALELEGRVRRLDETELEALLHAFIERNEGRLPGEPWRANETSEQLWRAQLRGIAGFALEIAERRPTFKLSQKRTPSERAAIAGGLEAAGSGALAALMRAGLA